MEFRPFSLAREWLRAGHRVRIIAGSPSHLRTRSPALRSLFTREEIDGVDFEWLKLPRYHGNGVRRAANIVAFAGLLRLHSRALVADFNPDIVIASSTHPLDFFGARSIARRCGARLVFEVHDLWPMTLIELGGMSARHPFVLLLGYAERLASSQADVVVSILPRADAHLVGRGMPASRYVHVPNGISIAESDVAEPLPPEHEDLVRTLRAQGRFLIGYAGGFGIANAMDDLISAAAHLNSDRVAFLLWGDGPRRQELVDRARAGGLSNVYFLGHVQRAAVRPALEACDVLYLGWKRRPIYRFGLSPNKLYDYMAAARPILHATSAPADPVSACGCGISVPSEQPDATAAAITRLMGLRPDELAEMGARGRRYVTENHDYPVLAAKLLEAVEARSLKATDAEMMNVGAP